MIEVRYEELVDRPREALARVADFCWLRVVAADLVPAAGHVHPVEREKGPRRWTTSQQATLDRRDR